MACGGIGKLAAERLLVDGHEATAAARKRPEDAEHALLGAIEDLDDPAGIGGAAFAAL